MTNDEGSPDRHAPEFSGRNGRAVAGRPLAALTEHLRSGAMTGSDL